MQDKRDDALLDRLSRLLLGPHHRMIGTRRLQVLNVLVIFPLGAVGGGVLAIAMRPDNSPQSVQLLVLSIFVTSVLACGFWVWFYRRSASRQAGERERLHALEARLEDSDDTELREIVAEYAEDEVAELFEAASLRARRGGWVSIGVGLLVLVAGAIGGWRLAEGQPPGASVADSLGHLAFTLPAVYAAGVLFKRGGVLQDEGVRLQASGIAIRAIPLIGGRITEEPAKNEFLRAAYGAQLGFAAVNRDRIKPSIDEDLTSKVVEALLK